MGLPLTTRVEYKAYAGLNSSTDDVLIDIIIPKVSALIKSVCRRSFVDYVDEPKLEILDGGTLSLSLEEYPILSVSSLEYSSDYGNTYTELTEFSDFAVIKNLGSIRSISTSGFTEAINGYRVTYTAGYEEIPPELKLAVFDLITYYIRHDYSVHSNRAPGANSVQIEYITTTNLPAHIKRILDLYAANYN
jgi:hypothetical protein